MGRCLMYMKHFSEAEKILEEAKKLVEDEEEQSEPKKKVLDSLKILKLEIQIEANECYDCYEKFAAQRHQPPNYCCCLM